ncbi:hypothetical protein [Rickettsiella endosymbiont of Miltochrista miniata]|uniref:hypothetical protein n=1 Tax=Rickettsiella endosymbiont of Miltochrista miniata TaxID=3066239 RepID=UPI00313AE807
MQDYIKLNVLEGSLQVIKENKIPVPKENEIIYDASALFEKPLEKSEAFKLDKFSNLYKKSLGYVKERNMGDYGKGIFTKGWVLSSVIFLPYTGLYISSELEKEHIVGELYHSRYNLRTGHQITCLTKENLGLAHSAQHLPTLENRRNDSAICANLMTTLIHIKIKFNKKINYLHVIVLRNEEDLKANSLLGYDYGFIYWKNIKSPYVEWDLKGHIVNKVALLETKFKEESLVLTVSQTPKTKYFQLPEPYMVIFPKGIREELFNPDKLQINLPVMLVSTELIKLFKNEKTLLVLPIVNFLQANHIKPFFKDSQPKYVLDNDMLYLETEFLENLTACELERLIPALNVPEIIFNGVDKKYMQEENTGISSELSELLEILKLSEITPDNSGQKLKSPGSSQFFKPANNESEASCSHQASITKKNIP